jgi:hypothetical protein
MSDNERKRRSNEPACDGLPVNVRPSHNFIDEVDQGLSERGLNGKASTASATVPVGDDPKTQLLSQLRAWAGKFQELGTHLPASEVVRHSLVSALVHEGIALVALAIDHGLQDEEIRTAIAPVRALQRASPFVRRLQDWPRGFPGDFETIEYICGQENRAEVGTLAWYIEAMTLNTSIAQQHRNKVSHQAALLADLVTRKPDSRILIVACGGAADARQVLTVLKQSNCRLVLNDMDAGALAYCRERLASLADRVQYIQGNAFRCFRQFADHEPFDLVLCGGLFDYLNDRQIIFLLQRLVPCLCNHVEGTGRLFFTNIKVGNPYRTWMEYFADWRLIERTSADLQAVLSEAGFPPWSVSITTDATGLTWLVEAARP